MEASRRVLADACLDLLLRAPEAEVTFRAVAEAAGTSERTVYRYFPTRDELLGAARAAIPLRLGGVPSPTTVGELRSMPERLFPHFEAQVGLVRLLLFSPAGLDAIKPLREERLRSVREVLSQAAPGLSRASVDAAARRVRYLVSAYTWHFYRFEFGLEPDAVVDEVRDTLDGELLRLGALAPKGRARR